MVQPLANLEIFPSGFGSEIVLNWILPDELPANYKVYLFRRSNNDVTQGEINSYFEHINDLSGYNYNSLFVNDKLAKNSAKYCALGDYDVLNDTTHYYKLVLRDEDTGEVSVPTSGHAIPHPVYKVNIKDGKKIVRKAIEKMLDNVYDFNGKKVQLGKDINIENHFSIEPIGENWIMLERVNGTTQTRYIGDLYHTFQASIIKGQEDLDVIRATFMTTESPDRRDKMANTFRAMKSYLIQFCKYAGARDCSITIEGDYYNPQVHGANAVGFVVVFTLLITNKTIIPKEELTHICEELKIGEEE